MTGCRAEGPLDCGCLQPLWLVDAMQPDQCLKKLYQIKKVGGVEAYMKAQQENQPSALDFAKKQVERHRQELRYWEDRVKFQEAQQGKD